MDKQKSLPISDTAKEHSPRRISYGTAVCLISLAAFAASAISVYFPLLITPVLSENARSYASLFRFDGTLGGLSERLITLSADELVSTAFIALVPLTVIYRRLTYASVFLRAFFLSLGLGFMYTSGAGVYSSVAATLSATASLMAYAYSALAALRFGDILHEGKRDGRTAEILQFLLKILSALGFYITSEVLILLPSAFV